jgi:hypothetical protein
VKIIQFWLEQTEEAEAEKVATSGTFNVAS